MSIKIGNPNTDTTPGTRTLPGTVRDRQDSTPVDVWAEIEAERVSASEDPPEETHAEVWAVIDSEGIVALCRTAAAAREWRDRTKGAWIEIHTLTPAWAWYEGP